MGAEPVVDGSNSAQRAVAQSSSVGRIVIREVDVVRAGRVEPFLDARPTLSSAAKWRGIALENYTVPAVLIPRHEHPEPFLHLVLHGTVRYEVCTKGRNFRFTSCPGVFFCCLGARWTRLIGRDQHSAWPWPSTRACWRELWKKLHTKPM